VHVATVIVTFPASFTPATLLVGLACLVVRGRAAVALAGAYVVAAAIEVIVKSAVTRPTLAAHTIQIIGFDDSFPSGHTIRAVFVVSAVAALWPKARIWAAAWAVCAIAFVELGGLHVPSDIVGGLLVAATTLSIALRLSRFGVR
jgi:membrane-associated phospholipid phosphatase